MKDALLYELTDKESLRQDWNSVGNDIRVALGLLKPKKTKIDTFDAFLAGIKTLNPFGSMRNNIGKYR